jgi:hypothetical protein
MASEFEGYRADREFKGAMNDRQKDEFVRDGREGLTKKNIGVQFRRRHQSKKGSGSKR